MKYLKTYESFNKRENCIEYILSNQKVTDDKAYRKDELEQMTNFELGNLCDEIRAFNALVGVHYNFGIVSPNQHQMGL